MADDAKKREKVKPSDAQKSRRGTKGSDQQKSKTSSKRHDGAKTDISSPKRSSKATRATANGSKVPEDVPPTAESDKRTISESTLKNAAKDDAGHKSRSEPSEAKSPPQKTLAVSPHEQPHKVEDSSVSVLATDAQKQGIAKRTAMVAIVVVVLILSAAAIALVFVVGPYFHVDEVLGCDSSQCIRFKQSLADLLNHSVNPCENYYSFVCDRWIDANNGSGYQEEAARSLRLRVHANLLKKTAPPDHQGTHVLSRLYSTCYRFMVSNSTSLSDVVTYGTSFLNTSSLLQSKDEQVLTAKLIELSLAYGVYSVYGLRVLKWQGKTLLYLFPGGSIKGKLAARLITLHSYSSMDAVRNISMGSYVREVLKTLYSNYTDTEAQQLVDWDEKFDTLFRQPSKEDYRQFKELALFAGDMKLEILLGIINSLVPPSLAVKVGDTVLVAGLNGISKVYGLLRDKELKTRVLYLSVNFLTDVLGFIYLRQYAPKGLDATIGICLTTTRESLAQTWPYVITSVSGYPDRASDIRKMARSIKDTAVKKSVLKWMDEYTWKSKVEATVEKTSVILYEKSEAGKNVSYESFRFGGNEFIVMYLNVRKFEMRVSQLHPVGSHDYILSDYQDISRIRYDRSLKSLIIPTALQGPPVFYSGDGQPLPFFVNYGTVGVLMAKEIVHSFQVQRLGPRVNSRFEKYVSCLRKVRQSLGVQGESKDPAWNAAAFAWAYGSRLAYDAMLDGFPTNARGTSALDLARELFFIRSCLLSCTSQSSRNQRLLPTERCQIPLQSNADFTRYYKCPDSARDVVHNDCIVVLYAEG